MPPFRVNLKPSKPLIAVSAATYAVAAAIIMVYFSGSLKIILLLLTITFLFWTRYQQNTLFASGISRIDIDAKGKPAVFFHREKIMREAVLLNVKVSRRTVFLHWVFDKQQRHQAITADMTDKTAFRRLKVWAKWGQK
ncbi:protein YgfX [Stenoxybacter acetivorans]|uniref:protein YgfX n=1 Tax=Stenoxybacter acetivorans TaxID=422441 RepID=UPI00055AE34C|nr:protein YgfX [Stenoxybacter acetivorans]